MTPCAVDGCDQPRKPGRSRCPHHYCQHRRDLLTPEQQQRRRDYMAAYHRQGRQRPRSSRLIDDDIDPVAVSSALQGHRMTLNRGERRQVIAILTRLGLTHADIATRIGFTARTVQRDLAHLKENAA